jgi:hypothetical protein
MFPEIPPDMPIGYLFLGVTLALTAAYFWAKFLGFA